MWVFCQSGVEFENNFSCKYFDPKYMFGVYLGKIRLKVSGAKVKVCKHCNFRTLYFLYKTCNTQFFEMGCIKNHVEPHSIFFMKTLAKMVKPILKFKLNLFV